MRKTKKLLLGLLALLTAGVCSFGVAGCDFLSDDDSKKSKYSQTDDSEEESDTETKDEESEKEEETDNSTSGGEESDGDGSEEESSDAESDGESSGEETSDTESDDDTDSDIEDEPVHIHSYILEVADEEYLKEEGNCEKKAVYYKSCECGEVGEESFEGDYGQHDGQPTCGFCGTKVYSAGLEYTLSEDETYYTVSRIGACTDTDIIIPTAYQDLPVTSIGDWAFRDCRNLISITISDSVTSIGELAFAGCSSLTSVTIPDSVTSISSGAFAGCALTSITIPDSVMDLGNSAFAGCVNLTSITIPDSVTSIGAYAFKSCYDLTSIMIGDGVGISNLHPLKNNGVF